MRFSRSTPPYRSEYYIPQMELEHEQLATGTSGTVYQISPTLVLKITSLFRASTNCEEDPVVTYANYRTNSTSRYKREVATAKKMGELGIGPKVYGYWIYDDVDLTYYGDNNTSVTIKDKIGLMLMDKVKGMTAEDYFKQYPGENLEEVIRLVKLKLEAITNAGYYGFDIVPSNIMLTFSDPRIIDSVTMIDFDCYEKENENGMEKMKYVFKLLRRCSVRKSKRIKK